MVLGDKTMMGSEIREALNLKSKGSFYVTYIKPALEGGIIVAENTISRFAPNQRYRLTDKGLAFYYSQKQQS